MRPIRRIAAAVAILCPFLLPAAPAQETKEDAATKQVKVQDLTLTVPDTWRQTQPTSSLRLAQFTIPAVMGDQEPTELAVFSFAGGGGGIDDNLRRWINQFEPQGRDVSLTKGKSAQGEYYFADIRGTYLMPVGPPIRQQTQRVESARMFAIILQTEKGVYYLRMAGPRYTVSAQEHAIRKAIGGSQGEEKPYELADDSDQ